MAEVRLSIGGREYIVTCQDGEERRLNDLGKIVDEKVREAGGSAGGLNESRQLLFASLLLADKLYDKDGTNASTTTSAESTFSAVESDQAAAMLEKLADRLETVASRLEE